MKSMNNEANLTGLEALIDLVCRAAFYNLHGLRHARSEFNSSMYPRMRKGYRWLPKTDVIHVPTTIFLTA